MSAPTRQLAGIQYLRGIAAMMVAYVHLVGQIPAYAADLDGGRWFDAGRLAGGVDIFFVISGFIMVVTSQKLTATEFARRRLVRIVPLYWVLTLLLAALTTLAPSLFRTTHLTLPALVKSLLFVPYVNPDHGGDVSPLLVPGWSLNVEMFFYLVFAVSLLGPLRRFQVKFICGLFGLLMLLHLTGVGGDIFGFYTQPRVLEFCGGAVLGRLYLARRENWAPGLLLLCAVPLLIGLRLPQNGFDGIVPAIGIVCAMLVIERNSALPSLPWLSKLGDASYSIYLTHIFTLGVMRTIWSRLPELPGSPWAAIFAVISMVVAAAGGLLCYTLIERPLVQLFHQKKARQS